MSKPVIPEAAVGEATRALHANSADRLANSTPWDDLTDEQVATFRAAAREILEAAAPHMLAGPHPTMSSEVTAANNAHIAACRQCQETFG